MTSIEWDVIESTIGELKMGLSGDSRPRTAAEGLRDAVKNEDRDASLRLLEAAGGSCQARALARAATSSWMVGEVAYSIVVSGDKETLMLSHIKPYMDRPLVGIEQPRCNK